MHTIAQYQWSNTEEYGYNARVQNQNKMQQNVNRVHTFWDIP